MKLTIHQINIEKNCCAPRCSVFEERERERERGKKTDVHIILNSLKITQDLKIYKHKNGITNKNNHPGNYKKLP